MPVDYYERREQLLEDLALSIKGLAKKIEQRQVSWEDLAIVTAEALEAKTNSSIDVEEEPGLQFAIGDPRIKGAHDTLIKEISNAIENEDRQFGRSEERHNNSLKLIYNITFGLSSRKLRSDFFRNVRNID